MTASPTRRDDAHLTVGQLARRTGVTVRTLHHYDELGLLVPSGRSASGYRLYREEDALTLASIVTYRRLGFPLEEIAEILQGSVPAEHLRRQRDAVIARIGELAELVDALDSALEATMTNTPASPDDLRRIFGDGYDETRQAEAEARWGDTEAWRQSRERNATRTPAEWTALKAEMAALNADLAAAKRAGATPDSVQAAALVERHRRSIEQFYDVSPQLHRALGDMYVTDPRFTASYDDLEPGLAQWLREAIHAHAGRDD